MREQINAFLSNDSSFGRLMTRLYVMICANLLFVLFSMPVVTAGPAWAALCYTMLKVLRGDGSVKPFRTFWKGFRGNLKQAGAVWLIALLLVGLGALDLRICAAAGGWIGTLRYAVYALGMALLVLLIYLFPVMAAFENTLPSLLRSALYFALHRPWKFLVLLFFHAFPMLLTYTDPQDLPLYAFLWTFIGFGAVAMLTARLLLPEFEPYLPLVDGCGDFVLDEDGNRLMPGDEEKAASQGGREETVEEILEEMRKLGM